MAAASSGAGIYESSLLSAILAALHPEDPPPMSYAGAASPWVGGDRSSTVPGHSLGDSVQPDWPEKKDPALSVLLYALFS